MKTSLNVRGAPPTPLGHPSDRPARVPSSPKGGTNVIDLEAFRQRKMRERAETSLAATGPVSHAMFVPVWICWVPVFTPFFP